MMQNLTTKYDFLVGVMGYWFKEVLFIVIMADVLLKYELKYEYQEYMSSFQIHLSISVGEHVDC